MLGEHRRMHAELGIFEMRFDQHCLRGSEDLPPILDQICPTGIAAYVKYWWVCFGSQIVDAEVGVYFALKLNCASSCRGTGSDEECSTLAHRNSAGNRVHPENEKSTALFERSCQWCEGRNNFRRNQEDCKYHSKIGKIKVMRLYQNLPVCT